MTNKQKSKRKATGLLAKVKPPKVKARPPLGAKEIEKLHRDFLLAQCERVMASDPDFRLRLKKLVEAHGKGKRGDKRQEPPERILYDFQLAEKILGTKASNEELAAWLAKNHPLRKGLKVETLTKRLRRAQLKA